MSVLKYHERFIGTVKAAKYLGISLRTFQYWVDKGKVIPNHITCWNKKRPHAGRNMFDRFELDEIRKRL